MRSFSFSLFLPALLLGMVLTSWHCGDKSSQGSESSSNDSTAEEVAGEPLFFAGWVDTIETPVYISLMQNGTELTGTMTYVKVGKPISVKGKVVDESFELEESIDGKTTGLMQFHVAEGAYEGTWKKSASAKESMPLKLHDLPELDLSDAEMRKTCDGDYGGIETISWPDVNEEGEEIEAEMEGENSFHAKYVGNRHFEFSMVTTTHHGFGCSADGYMVMVSPTMAMWWGLEGCSVEFEFKDNGVECHQVGWSPYYCGASGSLDGFMTKH